MSEIRTMNNDIPLEPIDAVRDRQPDTLPEQAATREWLWQLPTSSIASESSYPPDTLGLAISGGGIRSSTFALGFLQALARKDLLRRIDLMSTVSGGGYVGTFLGRYFDQLRHLPDADPQGHHPAQRIVAEDLSSNQSTTITWLREHANYLASTGSRESMFNLATFWRNFLALHFVLGMFFFAVFGIMNAAFYWDGLTETLRTSNSFVESVAPLTSAAAGPLLSVWWVLTEAIVWYCVLPIALGYWMASQDHQSRVILPVLGIYLLLTVALTFVLRTALPIGIFTSTLLAVVWAMKQARQQMGAANPHTDFRRLLVRHQLTHNLAAATFALFILTMLGVINSIGSFLAHALLLEPLPWHELVARIGLLVAPFLAGAPLLRGLAGLVANQQPDGNSWINRIARVPYLLTTITVVLGTLLPLSVIAFLGHAAYGNGGNYWQGVMATILAVIISLLLGARSARAFVNRSGPLALYASRLARVFMGAVNPVRHRQAHVSDVTALLPGDDVDHDRYQPHLSGGPLHLFNIAVNESVDVASQRGQRDRQGENMSIGPCGVSIARRWHARWGKVRGGRIEVQPLTDGTCPHPFLNRCGSPAQVERLSVRMWMAISGAAISSGACRLTGAAFSLLVTLGNFRLGYWWDSGLPTSERAHSPISATPLERAKQWLMGLLTTQSLLVSELRGRFGGPWRRYIYLSDGGHFENSGAYELLRRRVPLLIVIDGGQDRQGQTVGLGELARLARVDFGCELVTVDTPELQALRVPPGIIANLGTPAQLLPDNLGCTERHATLMKITYPPSNVGEPDPWHGRHSSWMLYVRLSVTGDETMDIISYQARNPDFPNQSTLDQNFDEPQFESYRRLGEHIGQQLFP